MGELLTVREVIAMLRLSRSTIYNLLRAGEFPRPIRLSARRIVWPKGELVQWLQNRSRQALPS